MRGELVRLCPLSQSRGFGCCTSPQNFNTHWREVPILYKSYSCEHLIKVIHPYLYSLSLSPAMMYGINSRNGRNVEVQPRCLKFVGPAGRKTSTHTLDLRSQDFFPILCIPVCATISSNPIWTVLGKKGNKPNFGQTIY